MKLACLVLIATFAFAQTPSEATMKQLMLDLIHPASNDIILAVNRGGPPDKGMTDGEWAAVRRSALTLEESGSMLTTRGRARDQGDWMKDAKMLADVGRAAYQAAQAKDLSALSQLTEALDASCTTCHKQYRPNVFPREGGSK
jgi:cytochrome c556